MPVLTLEEGAADWATTCLDDEVGGSFTSARPLWLSSRSLSRRDEVVAGRPPAVRCSCCGLARGGDDAPLTVLQMTQRYSDASTRSSPPPDGLSAQGLWRIALEAACRDGTVTQVGRWCAKQSSTQRNLPYEDQER